VRLALVAISILAALPSYAAHGPQLARAALDQVGVTTRYDPAYTSLRYPGGDVPRDRGVCSDVVVRSFRAIGVDLQVQVHEDMKRAFRSYPRRWGLTRPDPNIDHRRVANLMTYFDRRGRSLPLRARFEPGDVVAWRLPNGLLHIGVVSSDRATPTRPLVVHNIGSGAQNEDVLEAFTVIGHYRW
jgi:uncharacterized protein YijF (DUF1287 family)